MMKRFSFFKKFIIYGAMSSLVPVAALKAPASINLFRNATFPFSPAKPACFARENGYMPAAVDIAFSPKGRYFATANSLTRHSDFTTGGDISIFDLESQDGGYNIPLLYEMYSLPNGLSEPQRLAWSSDGAYLAALTEQQKIVVFSVDNNKPHSPTVYHVPSHAGHPCAFTFSPDNTALVIATRQQDDATSERGYICVIPLDKMRDKRVAPAEVLYLLPEGYSFPKALAFSPDGKFLGVAASGAQGGALVMVSVVDGAIQENPSVYPLPNGSSNPVSVAFSSHDLLQVATANYDSHDVTLFLFIGNRLVDATSYALPEGCKNPSALIFSPNGKYLVTANPGSFNVALFEVRCASLANPMIAPIDSRVSEYPNGHRGPSGITFSPNNKYFVTANGQAIADIDHNKWLACSWYTVSLFKSASLMLKAHVLLLGALVAMQYALH